MSRGRVIDELRVVHIRTGSQGCIVYAELALVCQHENLGRARAPKVAGFPERRKGTGRGVILTVIAREPGAIGGLPRRTTIASATGVAGVDSADGLVHR